MEMVFFPLNFLFSLAPALYALLLVGLAIAVGGYSYRTYRAVEAEGYQNLPRRRLAINLGLVILLAYGIAGGGGAAAPKAVIATPPSANEQYLRSLDASPRVAGETRSDAEGPPSWEELQRRTEQSAAEQEERIQGTGRDSSPEE